MLKEVYQKEVAELKVELAKLQDDVSWYFECSDLQDWQIIREDVDCRDMHGDTEPCSWCDSYEETTTELECAERQLRKGGE